MVLGFGYQVSGVRLDRTCPIIDFVLKILVLPELEILEALSIRFFRINTNGYSKLLVFILKVFV